jgi:DNA-binding NtrC family response regulator
MQPKLLQALESRTLRRVGSNEQVAIDARVIAASNRDLRQEVNRGAFRNDLFYRLNTVTLRVPALRERREDVPLLVDALYRRLAGDEAAAPPPDLAEALARRDWPGNVRELRSAVERALLIGEPETLDEPAAGGEQPGDRPRLVSGELSFRDAKERAIASWERSYVAELVKWSEGNLSRAARRAKMDRNHLRELLRRHGVSNADD